MRCVQSIGPRCGGPCEEGHGFLTLHRILPQAEGGGNDGTVVRSAQGGGIGFEAARWELKSV